MLQRVNRTCKRLNNIINCNSVLWRNISIENDEVTLSEESLQQLLEHSSGFWTFLIPFVQLTCKTPDVDWLFVKGFGKAKELYWLDLSECKLSTLSFLTCLPNLQIVNLCGCYNLVDEDFFAIQKCCKLEQLYVSFTKIKPSTIVLLASKLNLSVLDACAIPLSINNIQSIFDFSYGTLLYVHLTLENGINEREFRQTFCRRYLDCSIQIYK